MAVKVVIEGSYVRKSTRLGPGERRAVMLTPQVQNLIDGGFAVVVERYELPDQVAELEPQNDVQKLHEKLPDGDVAAETAPEKPHRTRRPKSVPADETPPAES